MSAKITLLFGVHAHQPVGNFASVVDDAFLRCYRPFLRALYRYPEFLFSLHFSGWLFDYLTAQYPSDIKLVKEMVQRGQVELFGGGETEPVLAVIPNRDRIAQLNSLSKKLEKKTGLSSNWCLAYGTRVGCDGSARVARLRYTLCHGRRLSLLVQR